MTHTQIDSIIASQRLTGLEKRGRIFAYLAGQPDRGVEAATEALLTTEDRRVAEYVAQYLEIIPGAAEEKTRAAERLRQHSVLVRSAARLVPWLPDELLDGFISDYLSIGEPKSPVSNVLYTMAIYAPERLRPFKDQIENEHVQQGLLSGSPDETVDELTDHWRASKDPTSLNQLALVRTDYALERVLSLREEIHETSEWEMLVELAGGLPGSTSREAGYRPSYMGFVADRGESDHAVGGSASGDVPICHVCEAPAAPLLSLSASSLPYGLSHDPLFYWYSCRCGAMDSTTVRIDPDGLTVYYGPKGPADPDVSLTRGERSLVLEEHPNQTGVSIRAVLEQTLHQVGGLPQWRRPDNHPRCPECHNAMPFIAFMDSSRTPFEVLDFGGIIYCFWCDDCRVSSTKIQG
ncbi:hypothetical protein [Streptomyces sp. NPDC002402]